MAFHRASPDARRQRTGLRTTAEPRRQPVNHPGANAYLFGGPHRRFTRERLLFDQGPDDGLAPAGLAPLHVGGLLPAEGGFLHLNRSANGGPLAERFNGKLNDLIKNFFCI
jgi:hypothetical protein